MFSFKNFKNSEYGSIAEIKKPADKDILINIVGNLLSIFKSVDIQLISYINPQKSEQKYLITFRSQEKGHIDDFKNIITAFFKDALFLDTLALDNFLSGSIYPLGQWNGYTESIFLARHIKDYMLSKSAFDLFKPNDLNYSDYPKIQALNISNRKPVSKMQYFLNKPYYRLFGNIDNLLWDKINFSAGFFWSNSQDLSLPLFKKVPIHRFLPFKSNRKNESTIADSLSEISKSFYPVLDWQGTDNKTVPIKLKNGIVSGFDVFDSTDLHYNGAIIGQTGKTTLIKHIAYSHYVKGDRVFIFPLNDQDGYFEIIEKVKAQEIILDIDSPICINPFSIFKDKNHFDFYRMPLVEWIYISSIKQNDLLSREDEDYIKFNIDKAICELWEEYKDALTLKIVFEYLKEQNDDRLSAFLDSLSQFIDAYGIFFNGNSCIDFNNHFVVVNTSKICNFTHPVLLGSLITAMAIHIKSFQEKTSFPGNYKRSLVFIDRLQELASPQIVDSLYFFYRGASKSGIGLFFASDTSDLDAKSEHPIKTLLSYSSWVFVTSGLSNAVCFYSGQFLSDFLRQENTLKALTLNSDENLLILRNERISEAFKYA